MPTCTYPKMFAKVVASHPDTLQISEDVLQYLKKLGIVIDPSNHCANRILFVGTQDLPYTYTSEYLDEFRNPNYELWFLYLGVELSKIRRLHPTTSPPNGWMWGPATSYGPFLLPGCSLENSLAYPKEFTRITDERIPGGRLEELMPYLVSLGIKLVNGNSQQNHSRELVITNLPHPPRLGEAGDVWNLVINARQSWMVQRTARSRREKQDGIFVLPPFDLTEHDGNQPQFYPFVEARRILPTINDISQSPPFLGGCIHPEMSLDNKGNPLGVDFYSSKDKTQDVSTEHSYTSLLQTALDLLSSMMRYRSDAHAMGQLRKKAKKLLVGAPVVIAALQKEDEEVCQLVSELSEQQTEHNDRLAELSRRIDEQYQQLKEVNRRLNKKKIRRS